MKKCTFFLVCVLFMATTIKAQECYNPTYKQGQYLFSQGEYAKALAAFKAATNCPDKPINNDLISWIKKTENKLKQNDAKIQKPNGAEQIYKIEQIDKAPKFPGGKDVFEAFLKSELVYPEQAIKNNVEGNIVIEVIIDKNGKIRHPKTIQSIDSNLEQEALRLLKNMPNWIPGEKNGKSVSVYQKITIPFKIEKDVVSIIKDKSTEIPVEHEQETKAESPHQTPIITNEPVKNETSSYPTKTGENTNKLKKHQFAIDFGIGSCNIEDYLDSYSMFCASITARYLLNFSRTIALDAGIKVMSDFAETTEYMFLIGPRLTTPTVGKRSSLYFAPKIGYGQYEDYGVSGLTYEVEVGFNINSHLFIGYSYLGASLSDDYLSGFSAHSIGFGYRF